MKRQLGLAWLLLGSVLMLIPIIAFLKASASNSKSRPVAPQLARLGDRATAHAAGRGAPRINLADGREVLTAYAGDPALQQLLEQNLVQPLAMASADFDEDGVPDLISAYAGPSSGILTILRGNVDAIYPNTPEANARKAQGGFTDAPFLSPARVFGVPVSPDFIGAGDFDADGHLDLAAAARGGHSLYLLTGNGSGGFGLPESIELPGEVTAMRTGEINRRDGLVDVIVGIITPAGPQVLIFQNARGALRAAPESFALPDAASDFAIGQFDSDALPDLAIAAGHNLMVVYGRDREASPEAAKPEAPAITSRQSFPFTVQSLASGDFTGKPQASLAALSGDGAVYLLSASFKKQPVAEQAKKNLLWETQILAQGTWSASARLLKAKVSSLPQDDLLVIDSSSRQLLIIETGNREPSAQQAISSSSGRGTVVDLEVEDEPVAALPMRLNADAIDDLVMLRRGHIASSVVPTAPPTIIVTSALDGADPGPSGSLREAMNMANTSQIPGLTIAFAISIGPQTINLTSPLPTITFPVTIDATTQPTFAGTPLIELNGSGVPAGGSGLTITSGICTVRGLVINRFTDISGTGGAGIIIQGGGNNLVEGNFIGTNPAGTAALGNFIGVSIASSSGNTVGGTAPSSRNLISGNSTAGIFLIGTPTDNQIQGNFIGTDLTGTAAVANNLGVQFEGVANNTLGGTAAGARNLISGNNGGVLIRIASTGIIVQGNFIGTDVSGNTALGNAGNGVTVQDGITNTIGGTAAGAGNVISGNGGDGFGLITSSGTTVQGNFIGTNAAGNAPVQNMSNGVSIVSSTNNQIGGTGAGAGNLISSNGINGLGINGGSNNTVQGNFIGTSASGTAILGNLGNGVAIGTSTNNTIGGATTAARNLISGNGVHGVVLGTAADGNTIQGNFIGLNVAGNAAIANAGSGITVLDSSNVVITGNVISGNSDDGVHLENTSPGGQNNTVRGNFIGTNPTGTVSIPNADNGVAIGFMPNNIVGGTAPTDRNIISGNGSANPASDGVEIAGNLATGNQVQGNFIGTDVTGAADLGNSGSGVVINDAPNNTIGGTSAGARNIISGNDVNGLLTTGGSATGNQVKGNFIGTDASGNAALANSKNGVVISSGSSNNTIGGTGAGNKIAFNGLAGVLIGGGAGNAVLSNSIFFNGGLGIDLNDDGIVTANDACDGDSGANNLQNFPVLTSTSTGGASTTIAGTLDSTPSTTFRIEFFSNPTCDASGNGEGQTFIGATNVTTSPSCTTPINVTLAVAVPGGSVITATATDSSNNTSEFSACVTVVVVACTLICPPDLIITIPNAAPCAAAASYSPTTSGACGAVSCAPPSGSQFAVGATTVTCTTAILGGSSESCSFTVTVLDTVPPQVFCPASISTQASPGQASAAVSYPAANVTDNCSGASVLCSPASGTRFPVGLTVVTCTATDSSSNSASCAFSIVVIDAEAPVIKCPSNVSVATTPGQTSAVVNYPPPTVTDNSPGVSVVCSPASGASFPVGTTTVTCTATDSEGNKASCSFIVGVGGAQAQVNIPGGKQPIEFGANTPVGPTRKPPKPKNNPCSFFTVENIGFGPLVLTLESISRVGTDVDSKRISDPNDTRYFSLSLVNADQVLTPIDIGAVVTIQPGRAQGFCLRFIALIPALAGKTTGLAASDNLPDTVNARVTFRQDAGASVQISLLSHVATALLLIDPVNPRRPPVVGFLRSGNDITVSYAVFDPNLDVSRAKYEFLDANGQVVAGPFEIDLTEAVRALNLVKGQSFSVEQRFTGASSNSAITGVRVTVFDGETSAVGASSTASGGPISASSIQSKKLARGVTLYLPAVRLGPQRP